MRPEFVLMLTRHDRTVADAQDLAEEALAAGIRHIGFKDVGLALSALDWLTKIIRSHGGTVYLEVVSLERDQEVASACAAVALGVDHLLGGTRPKAVLPILAGTGIRYWPFPGRVVGHPSRLEGPIEEIAESARRLAALEGVHGLDLLAYRFEGDVPRLIASVVAAVQKPVLVAGSIDRPERIATVARAGAAAFTVGTAALDRVFPSRDPSLAGQLAAIRDAVAQASPDPA